MSDHRDDSEAALRAGLRRLPVPETRSAAEFDANVRAALRQRLPWWLTLWTTARPLLSGAACSLAVMLALLQWMSRTPVAPHPRTASESREAAALDPTLERADLSTASLCGLAGLRQMSRRDTPEPINTQKPHAAGHSAPEGRSPLLISPAA
jgi:hypothetical protein